jgi:hypothetical protein
MLAGVMAVWLVPLSAADDHLAWSMKRTFMGRTFPPQTSEVWIADGKTYVREGVVVTITRLDLGKKWILNQRTKKYLEEPLTPAPAAAAAPPKEDKFRIQEYGWNYVPVYEWSAKETGETAAIDGRTCAKIVLTGEADYATESREIWIAKEAPIDPGRYYARVVEPNLEAALLAVYRAMPALKTGLAVKTVTTQERPIGSPIVWENVLTKLETAEPPAGIYDLPADYKQAKTREEWAGR